MKMYKVINNSIANKLIDINTGYIKPNEFEFISVAPTIYSLISWAKFLHYTDYDVKTNIARPFVITDDEIYIVEIDVDENEYVDFNPDNRELGKFKTHRKKVKKLYGLDNFDFANGYLECRLYGDKYKILSVYCLNYKELFDLKEKRRDIILSKLSDKRIDISELWNYNKRIITFRYVDGIMGLLNILNDKGLSITETASLISEFAMNENINDSLLLNAQDIKQASKNDLVKIYKNVLTLKHSLMLLGKVNDA